MQWLTRLFGGRGSSAEIAKNRLKVVLTYDRTNLTPDMMNTLQDEIVKVISQHIDIDRAHMSFSTERADNGEHLIADIPIRAVRSGPVGTGSSKPEPVQQSGAKRKKKEK